MNEATARNAHLWMPYNSSEANKKKRCARERNQPTSEMIWTCREPPEKMLKWKYKFSVHPNHLYYSKWEIVYYNSFCCFSSCHYCWCWCGCCCVWCRFTNARALVCITLVSYFLFFHTRTQPFLFYTIFLVGIFCFPLSNRHVLKCTPFVSCAISLQRMREKKRNIWNYLPSHWQNALMMQQQLSFMMMLENEFEKKI